jgi:hypothetical protein
MTHGPPRRGQTICNALPFASVADRRILVAYCSESDGANHCPDEIPFDAIKSCAQEMFEADLKSALDYRECHQNDVVSDARILFPLVCMVAELTAIPFEGDKAFIQQVREAGLSLIDHWDVRCVGQLIKQFPPCVPKSWRGARLHCRIDESDQWIISRDADSVTAIENGARHQHIAT